MLCGRKAGYIADMVDGLRRVARRGVDAARHVLSTPRRLLYALAPSGDLSGYRLTTKRLLNLWVSRYESRRIRTVLRARPTRLVIEPTNTCNLRCPHCHTGAGRFGRKPAMLEVDRWLRVLDEIGDYLFFVEVFNWGEALLHPRLPEIVAAASARGIATRINTHFNVRFTDADATRLVESGLTDLFVAVDGATQEVYEQYRVGGDLALVRRNCERLAAAKARLGRSTPRVSLQFLEFPFNVGEGPAVEALAKELGAGFLAFRGAIPDAAWGRWDGWPDWFLLHAPTPCQYLWDQPVFTVDGNLAPCRGLFQARDDVTHIAAGADDAGARSFMEAWNHPRLRAARGFFHSRDVSDEARTLPCFECPTAIHWDRWRTHRDTGGDLASFDPQMERGCNAAWNYFWERGQIMDGATPRRPSA